MRPDDDLFDSEFHRKEGWLGFDLNRTIGAAVLIAGVIQVSGPVLQWCRERAASIQGTNPSITGARLVWEVFIGALWYLVYYACAGYQLFSKTVRNVFSCEHFIVQTQRSTIPDLETVPGLEIGDEHGNNNLLRGAKASANHSARGNVAISRDLAPAFLRNELYPRDWKVYHSILGVVTKTNADAYDTKQKEASCVAVSQASTMKATTHADISPAEDEKKDDAYPGGPERRKDDRRDIVLREQPETGASESSVQVLRSVLAT